jgi:hypothetical protein
MSWLFLINVDLLFEIVGQLFQLKSNGSVKYLTIST